MVDIFDPEKRSAIMRAIKPRGNLTTEKRLVKLLKAAGIKGWRRHVQLPGRPDFCFWDERVVVFVDGDFWHGHPLKKLPQTNQDFWINKIGYNRAKDRRINKILKNKGWKVVRIWESSLRKRPQTTIRRISNSLKNL